LTLQTGRAKKPPSSRTYKPIRFDEFCSAIVHTNMNTKRIVLLSAAAWLASAMSATAATSFGVSFLGRSATTTLYRDETAGVVPQANWNNVNSGDPPVSGVSMPLVDSTGAFTDVRVIYEANDSWNSDGPTITPDDRLLKGIIKANPNPDTAPTNGTERMTFTVTNLTAGTYDVIVYTTENGANAQMNLSVGPTTYFIIESNLFDGTFVAATSTTPGTYDGANYAQFSAVAAAANGTITITATKNIVNPQVNDGIGVAGIQFVQVSGSSTFPTNKAAPVITQQPVGTTVIVGQTAIFTVATDGPWDIQWFTNGVAVAGEKRPTYNTGPRTLAQNGQQVTARVSNNVSSLDSTAVTLSVVAGVNSPGFLTVNYYSAVGGIGGILASDLLADPSYPDHPTSSSFISPAATPVNRADNFGGQISGLLTPTVSGDYYFFIRSDDGSALYLSSNNTIPDPSTATPIAEELDCCDPFMEIDSGDPATTATPISLVAGTPYGILALYKEGGGGDYMEIAWRLATDTTPAAQLKPIPGKFLTTLANPAGRSVSISSQPANTTVVVGNSATFTVGVVASPDTNAVFVQWQKNSVDIAGANGTSYTTPALAIGDTGTQYRAVVTIPGNITTNSAQAAVTVILDNVPPVVVGATAFPGSTKVGLMFDEALDPASGGTAANYTVNGAAVTSAFVRTNVANELTNEKNLVQLTVATALTANFTVTVSGVKDALGNTMASTNVTGKILNLTSTDIGSSAGQTDAGVVWGPDPLFPSTVTTWGPGAFDVLCNGNDYWNNADGFNFVWEPKTNNFDVKVRVVSVSPIDNWSAGAIEVREGPVTPNGGGWELARNYFCKVDYGGPDIVLNSTTAVGANAYEFNCRLAPGDPAVRETGNGAPGGSVGNWGTGTGPGNPGAPPYPNAWIRIARVKVDTNDFLRGYSSADGITWDLRREVDLNGPDHAGFLDLQGNPAGKWPDVCYVGLGSTSHTGLGNNNATNNGTGGPFMDGTGLWYSPVDQPYGCYVIYRDYGDVVTAVVPTLAYQVAANGTITLTYTGTLVSSETVTGTYLPVSGATNPFTVDPKTSGKAATFYRARQ
jgi:hypothetical protein